jgi:hypothetical protein
MHLLLIRLVQFLAQEDAPVGSWKRVTDAIVPIAIFLGVMLVLIWQQRKGSSSSKREIERHHEHMRRVEEQLERIAKAVERDRGV